MESNKPQVRHTEEEELAQKKADFLKRQEELSDLRKILSMPEGIRFFKRFFDEAKMFQSCFTGNSSTYHNEGRRDLGLKFFADCLEASPEKIPELLLRNNQ